MKGIVEKVNGSKKSRVSPMMDAGRHGSFGTVFVVFLWRFTRTGTP